MSSLDCSCTEEPANQHQAAVGDRRYLLADSQEAVERERLNAIERTHDPASTAVFSALGVASGWRCLELGAGGGSLVRWLAAQVGPAGKVVATDINPRFLVDLDEPNVEIRRHDILTDPLETNHYDVVHCRFLLEHLPDLDAALTKMISTVRPGGWLFIEVADLDSLRSVDDDHPSAALFDRVFRMQIETLQTMGIVNHYLGRRCRAAIEARGLIDVSNAATTAIVRGGEDRTKIVKLGAMGSADLFINAGLLTEDENRHYLQVFDDPSFTYIDLTIYRVWGRKPAGAQSKS
jgi:SAM-dependent methyltransferase